MQIQSNNNNNNDHAFEALLQSQRELLSQMKYGTTPVKWNTSNAQATGCGFEKLVFNRRSSLDQLFPSKSSGTTHDDTYKLPSLDQFDLKKKTMKTRKHPIKSSDALSSDPKKRKVVTPCKSSSSTGLLLDNVDDLPIKADFSESSERSFELDFELLDFNDASSLIEEEEEADKLEQQMESTLVTEAETDDDDEEVEPLADDEIVVQQQQPVQYGPEDAQKILQAFRAAMERSQYTQQSIHDWDKKMGLKRSHSKTMRLSARSRKKLRALFKRDPTISK